MRRYFAIFSILLLSCTPDNAGVQEKPKDFIPLQVERLPSLNTPRCGHSGMIAGGQLTVFGGHTDGFVRAQSAEYFSSGAWHEVPMVYPHDGGFTVQLADGTVMLGGGSGEDFGIGQSWGVEVYTPEDHSFRPVCIMDRKRAFASACPLPDGRILVSGNWYADDALELYTPGEGFSFVKELPSGRLRPIILPAEDDYILFGSADSYGNEAGVRVDRLSGTSYEEAFLETWKPARDFGQDHAAAIGLHTFLFPARNEDGRIGLAKVTDGVFSLLEMEDTLPQEGIRSEKLLYHSSNFSDRSKRCVWIPASGSEGRIYLARVDYDATFDEGKASVQMFYADCPDEGGFPNDFLLLPFDGSFAVLGGCNNNNFHTLASVWKLSPDASRKAGFPWWLVAAGLLLAGGGAGAILYRKRKKPSREEEPDQEAETTLRKNLVDQIIRLIEEKELWKKDDLRLDDIAQELASNRTYISTLLNSVSGVKFSTLINGYRIAHAQKMLLEHPDILVDVVAEESGFSSRTAFFRNFKIHTGMTPSEWRKQAAG